MKCAKCGHRHNLSTSTTKLTRPTRLVRSFRSSFIKNAHNLASLGAEELFEIASERGEEEDR